MKYNFHGLYLKLMKKEPVNLKKEYYIKMTEVMLLHREYIECINNNNDKDKCKELFKKFNETCNEAYKYK